MEYSYESFKLRTHLEQHSLQPQWPYLKAFEDLRQILTAKRHLNCKQPERYLKIIDCIDNKESP